MKLSPLKVAIVGAIFSIGLSNVAFAAVSASAEASVAVSQAQAVQPKFSAAKFP